MTLWDLCIKRPVFTVMLISAPIVLGLVGRSRLGVDLLPNVEMPIVVVTTMLKGASVEEMETSVTKPIEQIINTVSAIDELKSTTKEGISQVVVQFFLEKDRDVAAQEVRDKVSTILSQLPVGTDAPIIDKVDLNAMPVMQIAVAGQRPMQEITELTDIAFFGLRDRGLHVDFHEKMHAATQIQTQIHGPRVDVLQPGWRGTGQIQSHHKTVAKYRLHLIGRLQLRLGIGETHQQALGLQFDFTMCNARSA